jgi:hypothetical protein
LKFEFDYTHPTHPIEPGKIHNPGTRLIFLADAAPWPPSSCITHHAPKNNATRTLLGLNRLPQPTIIAQGSECNLSGTIRVWMSVISIYCTIHIHILIMCLCLVQNVAPSRFSDSPSFRNGPLQGALLSRRIDPTRSGHLCQCLICNLSPILYSPQYCCMTVYPSQHGSPNPRIPVLNIVVCHRSNARNALSSGSAAVSAQSTIPA